MLTDNKFIRLQSSLKADLQTFRKLIKEIAGGLAEHPSCLLQRLSDVLFGAAHLRDRRLHRSGLEVFTPDGILSPLVWNQGPLTAVADRLDKTHVHTDHLVRCIVVARVFLPPVASRSRKWLSIWKHWTPFCERICTIMRESCSHCGDLFHRTWSHE